MCSLIIRIIVAVMLLLPAGAFAAVLQLPKTGQTGCWDASNNPVSCDDDSAIGQDGKTQVGVDWPVPRFIQSVPSKGILTDKLTDLVWLKDADCLAGPKTWQVALDRAKTLADGVCGLSDGSVAGQWRLPNRKELLSLSNFQESDGGVWLNSQGFVNALHGYYWTSDTYQLTPLKQWVYHSAGDVRVDADGNIEFRALYVRDLTGIKLAPGSHDFGNVKVGESPTPQTFTITSPNGTLNLSGVSITGTDSSMFTVNPGDGSSGTCGPAPVLAPGTGCTVAVTFAPTSVGAKTANLRVSSNAESLPVIEAGLTGAGLAAYSVSASVDSGNGSITSTNPLIVASGSPASFTLLPASGYGIGPVAGGTCAAGSFSGSTYTTGAITADCTVTFSFTPNAFTINNASGEGGNISCTPGITVDPGTVVSCTVTPDAGQHISSVTVDSVPQTITDQSTFTFPFGAVDANHSISATFAVNTYKVEFSSDGNGSISGEVIQTVNHGSGTTAVTAVPNPGSHFVNWTGPGGFTRTGSSLTLTNVTANQNITAHFSADGSAVTPDAAEHGSITPEVPQTIAPNSVATFTIKPERGYHIASVTGCGGTLNGSTYTTAPVTGSCTVTATFAADTMEDAVKAFRYVVGKQQLTDDELYRYDVAPLGSDWKPLPDDKVDMADVVVMLRRLVGLLIW